MTRNNDAYFALPQGTQMELMQGAVAFVEKNRAAGKCKEAYFQSDLKGGAAVWEVSSDEDVTRDMIENPMWPYTDFDVRPLIEWDAALKVVTKYYQQAVKKKA